MRSWIWFLVGMPLLSYGAVQDISSTLYAFAALKNDGSVVVWGDPNKGGRFAVTRYDEIDEEWKSTALSASLLSSGVEKIVSNDAAFAALKTGGAVVSWGDTAYGGDSSAVASDLASGVKEIVGTRQSIWSEGAFAALKNDGSVVAWGAPYHGGRLAVATMDPRGGASWNYRDLGPSLLASGVKKIVATMESFAALKDDGSVVTWGHDMFGGARIIHRLSARKRIIDISLSLESGVKDIFSSDGGFAALKEDGSLIVWGAGDYGGDATWLEAELGGFGSTQKVEKVFSTHRAYAAIREDGSVVTWGNSLYDGGNSRHVASKLSGGITDIAATNSAFAALTSTGGIVEWGYYGGHNRVYLDERSVTSGVSKLFANYNAFAALTDSGGVISWGWGINANATINAPELASGVANIVGHRMGNDFVAIKTDGSIIHWGYGTKKTVFASGSGINKVFASQRAYAGLKSDGTVVAWGDVDYGGSVSGGL